MTFKRVFNMIEIVFTIILKIKQTMQLLKLI